MISPKVLLLVLVVQWLSYLTFAAPQTAAHQALLSSTTPWSLLKFLSL